MACCANNPSTPNALDLPRFNAELKDLARGNEPYLRLVIRFDGFEHNKAAEQFLEAAVKQLCRDAGFAKVRSSKTYSSLKWQRYTDRFRATPGNVELQEPILERPLIRTYAIKTNLSRAVLADADCWVQIRRPFDGRQESLSEELRESIGETVDDLQLESKQKLCFKLSSTDAGEPIIEQLFSYQPTSPANVFARELGFDSMNYTHSPNGGAPESLVGKLAPDFHLPMLDGTNFVLSENIKDKIAVVTFWGVACGPCCVEAPHLSKLFEKYNSDKFTVVAVNAYDEDAETVTRFVQQESLRHPIVLNGGKVAKEDYHVGAYPTTFWIKGNGTVVDYVVGFDEGDEMAIEERIVRMLRH